MFERVDTNKKKKITNYLDITPDAVRVTGTAKQPIEAALDVSRYDTLHLRLWVLSLEGTDNPSVAVRLLTNTRNDTEEGWVPLTGWTTVTAADAKELKEFAVLLRYVRWEVTALTGTSPAAVFRIDGMGRKN